MKNRPVRQRRDIAQLFAVLGIIAFLVGAIFIGAAKTTDYRMAALQREGIRTTAKITEKYKTSGKGPPTPYLKYEFTDKQGTSFRGDDAYPFEAWNSLRIGDSVGVTYMPDDPAHNALTDRVHLVTNRNPVNTYEIAISPWLISVVFFGIYFFLKRRT